MSKLSYLFYLYERKKMITLKKPTRTPKWLFFFNHNHIRKKQTLQLKSSKFMSTTAEQLKIQFRIISQRFVSPFVYSSLEMFLTVRDVMRMTAEHMVVQNEFVFMFKMFLSLRSTHHIKRKKLKLKELRKYNSSIIYAYVLI